MYTGNNPDAKIIWEGVVNTVPVTFSLHKSYRFSSELQSSDHGEFGKRAGVA